MSRIRFSHAEICDVLGIEAMLPRPDWLPYASQARCVEILVDGQRVAHWGGAMRCGQCGYGVDIKPGPDNFPPVAIDAIGVCPKCGYDGKTV